MRFSFSYISTVLLLPVLLAGCSKAPVSEPASRELTVLIGTDGYGDGSYNDTMLSRKDALKNVSGRNVTVEWPFMDEQIAKVKGFIDAIAKSDADSGKK